MTSAAMTGTAVASAAMASAAGFGMLLSFVFALSGAAKLLDLPGTRSALISLRIPARPLHPAIAVAVPVLELVAAAALWVPVRWVAIAGAGLALVLMLAFTAVIAGALRRGDAVSCSCFGTLGSPEVTSGTLVRNVLLSAIAVVAGGAAWLGAAPGLLAAVAPSAAIVLAAVVGASAAVAVLIAGSSNRLAGEAPTGPSANGGPTGAAAPGAHSGDDPDAELGDYVRLPTPYVALTMPDGTRPPLRTLTQTQALLLIFLNPGCGPCVRLMPMIREWSEQLHPLVRVLAVLPTDPGGMDEGTAQHLDGLDAYDPDNEIGQMMDLMGRPSAVLLGADDYLAGGPVAGSDTVIEFVQDIRAQLEEEQATAASAADPASAE